MKNTYRFFVPPERLAEDAPRLDDPELAHQLGRVLRLGPGDRVLLLDGLGAAAELTIEEIGRGHVAGRIERRYQAGGEPPAEISLFLALLRPERFEWALQKAVELGVRRVVPVRFARSLPADRADEKKLLRWRRIAREAAEQSCRGLLPAVEPPIAFDAACAQAAAAGLSLILWEGEAPHLNSALRNSAPEPRPSAISLLSGPEGGITAEELTAARGHGIIPVSLGPRILRAETAPLAALAAIVYELEQ